MATQSKIMRSRSDVRSPVKHVPQLSLTGLRSSLQAGKSGTSTGSTAFALCHARFRFKLHWGGSNSTTKRIQTRRCAETGSGAGAVSNDLQRSLLLFPGPPYSPADKFCAVQGSALMGLPPPEEPG